MAEDELSAFAEKWGRSSVRPAHIPTWSAATRLRRAFTETAPSVLIVGEDTPAVLVPGLGPPRSNRAPFGSSFSSSGIGNLSSFSSNEAFGPAGGTARSGKLTSRNSMVRSEKSSSIVRWVHWEEGGGGAHYSRLQLEVPWKLQRLRIVVCEQHRMKTGFHSLKARQQASASVPICRRGG